MNQDKVKELLLRIKSDVKTDFTVIFTGKESSKVDGLYNRETCEILIHNRNFKDDNSMMYTAIHEFAHHIQFTELEPDAKNKTHSVQFWKTFFYLLGKAEYLKLYRNVFNTDDRFIQLTENIKENYLKKNGLLMKEFGKLLVQAYDLCQQQHMEFEDYVDRQLSMNRSAAKNIMKVYAMDVEPSIGFDNMKIVSKVKDNQTRHKVEEAIKAGNPHAEVKAVIQESRMNQEKPVTQKNLEKQKTTIERSIHALQVKLSDIDDKLAEYLEV